MRRLSKIADRGSAACRLIWCFAILLILFSLLFIPSASSIAEESLTIFEDFDTLEGWEDFYFPKIKEHSEYTKGEVDGISFLIANSSASASAFMMKRDINVYETPFLHWRWKVANIYEKGDLSTKSGDDSPLRVYIMFKYDPERASTGMKIKYGIAKALYGEYPPHASLNYIWASRTPVNTILESAYTDRSRMLVLQSGAASTGKWLVENANMLDDYRKAFGEDPPEAARIAIMNDSDNTGESAVSYIDFIEVSSQRSENKDTH